MELDLLITNAAIATMAGPSGPASGSRMQDVGLIDNGVIGVRNGQIVFVDSTERAASLSFNAQHTWDAQGRLVAPGLVDPHTHLVHAGSREHELALKLQGVSYLDILAQGGGILSTVESTRKATEDELLDQAATSIRRMLELGTTTVEAKSGYGLDVETELRQLRVAKRLNDIQPVDVVSTFLGPHAIPREYKGQSGTFLELMTDMLDDIKAEQLAEFCDIFCEDHVFSVEESRRFLEAAKARGFGVKIHADEIEPLGGAELAAELGAISAEHLLIASKAGLDALAEAGTIAVLLPGTSWNLQSKTHADARYLIDHAKAAVALATDYNPGSCPTESLQFVMAVAANQLRMTPEEILNAVTRNAAYAIGRGDTIGSIEVGKQADLVAFNARNAAYLVYHFGINHVHRVYKRGQCVVDEGHRSNHVVSEQVHN